MSENFRIKSDNNLAVAEMLIENDYFSASVHNSYYSVVQLILYIFHSNFKMSDKDMDKESRKSKKGFHNWLKNHLIDDLKLKKKTGREIRSFSNDFEKLKKFRVDADYKNILLTLSRAQEAYNLSIKLRSILQNYYPI